MKKTYQYKPKKKSNSQRLWDSLVKKHKKTQIKSKRSAKVFQSSGRYKSKKALHRKTQSKEKISSSLLKFVQYFFVLPIVMTALWPLRLLVRWLSSIFRYRELMLRGVFVVLFLSMAFRFAQFQIFSAESGWGLDVDINSNSTVQIVSARRGKIFMQDLSQGRKDIPLTSTEIQTVVYVDAARLQKKFSKPEEIQAITLEIASRLNINYEDLLKTLQAEVAKENPNEHVVILDNATSQQRKTTIYLKQTSRTSTQNSAKLSQYSFDNWLGFSEKQTRSYPQNQILAATIGYTPPYLESSQNILNDLASCKQMVEDNILRGTDSGAYTIGYYGLEQKYCSELGGLNGRLYYGPEQNSATNKYNVQNGSDFYLTIDENLQRRAEQILAQAVIDTTNQNGGPRNGAIIVMEAETGKVRALASYPPFDPNNYSRYAEENPFVFRNAATSIDYDPGSVIKPLTVAAGLNVFSSGVSTNGIIRGVPADYKFLDYKDGKIYEELDGTQRVIRNAKGFSYANFGTLGLKEIIRDSINTGVSDIADSTTQSLIKEYFTERFGFGQPTMVDLPGDEHGNIRNFENDLYCQFCYANFGFGQGFTASPLQLVRAYTPIANDGLLVEPYIIEEMISSDGSIDSGLNSDSPIYRAKPRQVITPSTANLVKSYMEAVVQEGYLGSGPTTASVDGYTIAGKTGTAEVNRPYIEKDSKGRVLRDEDGDIIQTPCDYLCNRKRGIYDHTFVGMGPAEDPKYIILVKLSEPFPGRVENFSSDTVGRPFSEMMQFTLAYAGIPKNQ